MRWRNLYLTPLCNRVGLKNRLVVSLMTARSCPVLLRSVLAPGWACVLLWCVDRAAGLAHGPLCSFQKHEFSVDMTCEGCSNAVSRVLNKLGGE